MHLSNRARRCGTVPAPVRFGFEGSEMRLKDRIFDLVFPDRRRRRKDGVTPSGRGRRRKGDDPADRGEGTDPRYFIRRRR